MAQRRSSLTSDASPVLAGTSQKDAIQVDGFDEDFDTHQPRPSKVPKKRQITGDAPVAGTSNGPSQSIKKPRRGRRGGKLRKMPEMPLDILFYIFAFLSPLDILRLSRTTKVLRNILMRQSSAWIWKEARQNTAGLPDCPPYLNESQYANLAFSPHCHFCFAPNTNTILWELRIRCCKKCMPTRLVLRHHMYHKFPEEFVTRCSELLPRTRHVLNDKSGGGDIYSVSEAEAICKKFFALKANALKLQEFITERTKFLHEINAHSNELDRWNSHRNVDRTLEIRAIRERRKEAILKKLVDCGWGEELEQLDRASRAALFRNGLVVQAKDLTDRIWTNIKPTLVKFMEDAQKNRLKQEKKHILRDRRRNLKLRHAEYVRSRPPNDIIPSATDIYFMSNCKSIVEDSPSDVLVTADSFNDIFDRLPQLIETWRADRNRDLLSLLPQVPNSKKPPADCSPLELATTFFICSSIGCFASAQPMTYPRILVHKCTRELGIGYRDDSENMTDTFESLGSEVWNHRGQYTFHDVASRVARSIVEACGFDPEVTTSREMDEADIWVECVSCSDNVTGRVAMNWQKAVDHACSEHTNILTRSLQWVRLTDADTMLANAVETTLGRNWRSCARCHMSSPLLFLKDHARNYHNTTELQQDDYYVPVDSPISKLHMVVTLPPIKNANIADQPSRVTSTLSVHSDREGVQEAPSSQPTAIELLDDSDDDAERECTPSDLDDDNLRIRTTIVGERVVYELLEDITHPNSMAETDYESDTSDVHANVENGGGLREIVVGGHIVYELLDD